MLSINDSSYSGILNRVYSDEKIDKSPSESYRNWMKMKRRHSFEVAEAGLEIIRSEKALSSLDNDTKEKLLGALLLHDIARIKNRDFTTGQSLKMDHGVEGARDVTALGITTPLIVVPVMIHNQINDKFIELTGSKLTSCKSFQKLSEEDQDFVLEQNRKFHAMPKQEQETIRLGINLVKDADKLANLLTAKDKFLVSNKPLTPSVGEKVLKRLLAGKLVRSKDRGTFADHALLWMSWANDFRFPTTANIFNKNNGLENMKQAALEKYAAAGTKPEDLQKLETIFGKAVAFLKNKQPHYQPQPHSLVSCKLRKER